MKALTFLTKLKQSRDFDGNLEYSLDEAIAELEALQQPKSCLTCNHLYEEDREWNTHCMVHEEESVSLRNTDMKSFYCNRYEKA